MTSSSKSSLQELNVGLFIVCDVLEVVVVVGTVSSLLEVLRGELGQSTLVEDVLEMFELDDGQSKNFVQGQAFSYSQGELQHSGVDVGTLALGWCSQNGSSQCCGNKCVLHVEDLIMVTSVSGECCRANE